MERDYGQEIDALRSDIDEIKSLLAGKGEQTPDVTKRVQPMPGMHPDERMNGLMQDCEDKLNETGVTGAITYLGVFASGGRQSNWMKKDLSTDVLLELAHPENGTAGRVLSCVSSQEKLSILTALLHRPMTVAELIEELGFTSTGQAYHHLNTLLSYHFVEEDPNTKKTYCIPGHRVQGIIMLLAGINDLMDGTWG
ncbi:MAG: winged helix-turn-helix transcriptional regulator [Clostridia bacterium]|nr:winged helix-turn-helix transcriptional regulator [Clostridia bacterium]